MYCTACDTLHLIPRSTILHLLYLPLRGPQGARRGRRGKYAIIKHVCGVCGRVAHAPLNPNLHLAHPLTPVMEEESSFFERERDRLTSEIASVSRLCFNVTITAEQSA